MPAGTYSPAESNGKTSMPAYSPGSTSIVKGLGIMASWNFLTFAIMRLMAEMTRSSSFL